MVNSNQQNNSSNANKSNVGDKHTKKDPITSKEMIEGAITLITALAWNEFAKSAIDRVFPNRMNDKNKTKAAIATLVYAVSVTIIVLIIVSAYNKAVDINNKGGIKNVIVNSITNKNKSAEAKNGNGSSNNTSSEPFHQRPMGNHKYYIT